MRFARSAFPALALAAATLLCAGVALAQPKPALVQDRDEPGRNPYQKQAIHDCDGQILCQVDLPQVPANMRLVVTTVTISINTTSGADGVPAACITQGTGGDFQLNFEITGAARARTMSQSVTHYYEAGQTPSVLCAIGSGTFSGVGRVGLAGYLVAVP